MCVQGIFGGGYGILVKALGTTKVNFTINTECE